MVILLVLLFLLSDICQHISPIFAHAQVIKDIAVISMAYCFSYKYDKVVKSIPVTVCSVSEQKISSYRYNSAESCENYEGFKFVLSKTSPLDCRNFILSS
jgi:hypothetical protein